MKNPSLKGVIKMKKSSLALILAFILAFSVFVGCSKTPADNGSSTITTSEDATESETSSTESKNSSTESKNSSTTGKNSSNESKTASAGISPEDWAGDEDNGNTEETKTSSTTSSGIKQYKNPKNLGLVAYHCSVFWCNSAGAELPDKIWDTPYEDRLEEFRRVVEAKYFNQYFLTADNGDDNAWLNDMDIVVEEAKIIAENGGSFWLYVNYNPQEETLKQYEEKLRGILNTLEKVGCRELVNGIHWDEPYYNNYSLKDLQDQMRINYTVFGLRNFPVFGLSEFSEVSPRTNKKGDPMPQVTPEYSKYITDAGFDYYSVDVRDGANNGGAYNYYTNLLGTAINSGKGVYWAYEDKLELDIGHNFNLWHFPCAYAMPTWAGTTADEDYCIAHLEFMAEDILNENYGGGIALYTYHTHTQSHKRVALQERIPLKDKNGNYLYYKNQEKWEDYFKVVKKYYDIFTAKKVKYINLGL